MKNSIKQTAKTICFVFLALLFYTNNPVLYSMEWPLESGIISRNFGWNNQGQPNLGINFRASGNIEAVDHGELLFKSEGYINASRLPSPLGSWVALDHGEGIISVYSRMSPDRSHVPDNVRNSSIIGQAGSSGWSNENGLYFSLYDRKERRWINPVMIITPLPDPGAPFIQAVRLRDNQGRLHNLAQIRNINQGRYTILVESSRTFTPAQNRPALAPFRIISLVNGTETGMLNFETYSARDGVLMVYRNGLVPVDQIYSPYPAYELGTVNFSRGQVTLEIISQDAGGNSRNSIFRFMVE